VPPHIFIQQFPSGAKYEVPGAIGASPRWSNDGSHLFFDDGAASQHLMLIDVRYSTGLSFGNPMPVQTVGMNKPSAAWRPYDLTPDDKIVMVTDAGATNPSSASTSRVGINVVVNWNEELDAKVPVRAR